jgi:5-methylcytosine-specific restriction endonuclease McrA
MKPPFRPHQEVLVLNNSYEVLNITSGKRAIVLLLKQKAEVLSHCTIRLVQYVRVPLSKLSREKPTKAGIYHRDGHRCQYCGSTRSLTIDHVLPRSRGGDDTWENLVVCCSPCNVRKGDRLLEHTGMVLKSRPKTPPNKVHTYVVESGNSDWLRYSYSVR